MYAIIKTGGKQYKVAVGDKLKVEKLAAAAGDSVQLPMLMSGAGNAVNFNAAGAATVSAKVLTHGRGEKIRVFKMKRRKDYRRTLGARQPYTEIQITAIGNNREAAAAQPPAGAAPSAVAAK